MANDLSYHLSSTESRNNADRMVLALRYPGADDAEPLCAVRKQIGDRSYLLAVYDADVLASLQRMVEVA